MIIIHDKNLKELDVLNKPYQPSVSRRANQVYRASFSLAEKDPKNEHCKTFNYVKMYGKSGTYYGLYRIMNRRKTFNEQGKMIRYECQHVITTLKNKAMRGLTVFENHTTEYVLQSLLDLQDTHHWQLGQVDFERYFKYQFENRNSLLSAILEVPKRFNEPYLITYDTTSYPWTINLIKPSYEKEWDYRWKRDIQSFEEHMDSNGVVHRLIPLGSGEGVNQLTIASVNNGDEHIEDLEGLDEDDDVIEKIWIDKRFEDPNVLMEEAQVRLNEWKEPKISLKVDGVDLFVKEKYKHLKKRLYSVGEIIVKDQVWDARILSEHIPDLHQEQIKRYEINNKLDHISSFQVDQEQRQYTNDSKSQGSTNILTTERVENADPNNPVKFKVWIPDNVIYFNYMHLTWETNPFRAYSRATKGGGAVVKSTSSGGGTTVTSSSGGGTTATSSSGGGTSTSTESGGGTTTSTPSGGNHRHRLLVRNSAADGQTFTNRAFFAWIPSQNVSSTVNMPFDDGAPVGDVYTFDADGDHTHSVDIPAHTHEFSVPNHTHDVTIPNHSHSVTLDPHTHDIELPDHVHDIEYGIYIHNQMPTSLEIKVDGQVLNESDLLGENIDITSFLETDANGNVKRNRYAIIEIKPDDLAQITASLVWGVYVQSHLGGQR